MALRCPANEAALAGKGGAGVLYCCFNQDNSCVALGTTAGVLIYNLQSHTCIYSYNVGAVSIVQMLFCTSLVAYVGAGLQPALTPRKLTLLNTATNSTIQDINFPFVVLAVLINKSRLVAVLEQQACVYALQSLAHICSIDTPTNLRGIGALSTCDTPCLMALPAGPTAAGALRVYNLMYGSCADTSQRAGLPGSNLSASGPSTAQGDGGSSVMCELAAHHAPLATLAWFHDASLLASASTKGTVIRVHRLPQAKCVAACRRGTVPATIHAMCWSPPNVQPPLLAVSSSRGSVHIFRLDEEVEPHSQSGALGLRAAGGASGMAVGLLSAVMRLTHVPSSVVNGPRPSLLTIRLPVASSAATISMLPRLSRSRQHTQSASTNETTAGAQEAAYDPDAVALLVATLDGILYEYVVKKLHSTHQEGPSCTLEGEWALKGASMGGASLAGGAGQRAGQRDQGDD